MYNIDTFSPNAKQGVSHINSCWVHIGPEHEPLLNAHFWPVKKVLFEHSKSCKCKLEFKHLAKKNVSLHHFLWTSSEDSGQIRNSAVICVTAAADVTEIGG